MRKEKKKRLNLQEFHNKFWVERRPQEAKGLYNEISSYDLKVK